jgi:hypothetical protein
MMSESKSRRKRRVTDSQVLQVLVIVGAVSVAFFAGDLLVKVIGGDALPEPVAVALPVAGVGVDLPAGVEIVDLQARLVADASVGWRVVWGLMSLLPALIVGGALWIMFRLLRDERDPFTMVNVKRLQMLAGLAAAYLAVMGVRGLVEMELERSLGLDALDTEFAFVVPFFLALLCGALAEVFRRGVAMREEQELTI